jgi:phospholipase D1/2
MLRSFEVAAIGAVVYCLSRVFKIYSDIIRNAEHYVYLENQFFITAIGDQHAPIRNTIGRAIVDAVVRAGKEGRKFKVIAVIPAVPRFAGDLRENAAKGTRAIMDYQYKSIL